MNHEQLIDIVARDMTEAEPSPDFRARVVAALPPTRRTPWLRLAIPAGAIAALAVAAVLSGVARPTGPEGPRVQGSKGPGDAAVLQRVELPIPSTIGPVGPLDPWTLGPLDRAEDAAWRSRAIAPLPEVAPISIAPIQPIGLSITPIIVTPIVAEPIVLPALDTRSGGRE